MVFTSGQKKVKSSLNVNGLQVEVDTSRETGGLYETGDRGWVYKLSKEAISKRKYVPGQWTNLELRTSG